MVVFVWQPRIGLLAPYFSSFRSYKNTFFRVLVNPLGRPYFFNSDIPKFPFYWTLNPLHYDEWPQTMMSTENYEVLNLLDSLPRQLPTKRIVAILNSPCPVGICWVCVNFSCIVLYVNLSYFVFAFVNSYGFS